MKTNNRPPDIEPYQGRLLEKCPVHQYGLDGKFIRTFESQLYASKETNTRASAISNCIRGKAKSAKGYQWRKA